ncbi:hypothetical protein INT48_004783 [Thamnidium elegans]|uniref:Uncharacterized protein n=1 Tax=Thamnidium elegans TaxID=101142 RepID=A0A8H7SLP0_9FUNG|nr:hypothetical protein INT48_004783 [Thamnidium elegans]
MVPACHYVDKNGHDNVYNEYGERVFDPMEGVLTEVSDPNVVLETITSQKSYLSLKPVEKETPANNTIKKVVELIKPIDNDVYKDYNDQTRDRMIEGLTITSTTRLIQQYLKEALYNQGISPLPLAHLQI